MVSMDSIELRVRAHLLEEARLQKLVRAINVIFAGHAHRVGTAC